MACRSYVLELGNVERLEGSMYQIVFVRHVVRHSFPLPLSQSLEKNAPVYLLIRRIRMLIATEKISA